MQIFHSNSTTKFKIKDEEADKIENENGYHQLLKKVVQQIKMVDDHEAEHEENQGVKNHRHSQVFDEVEIDSVPNFEECAHNTNQYILEKDRD